MTERSWVQVLAGGAEFFRVNFQCWFLFQYPFQSRVTAVAHKRSHSFCQKCRWQVTAKHTCTMCAWFCHACHATMHQVVVLVHTDATHNILINLIKPSCSCWCQWTVTQPWQYTLGELFQRPVLVLALNYRWVLFFFILFFIYRKVTAFSVFSHRPGAWCIMVYIIMYKTNFDGKHSYFAAEIQALL